MAWNFLIKFRLKENRAHGAYAHYLIDRFVALELAVI